ncbi:MAG: TPR end-of-group domain-containing protein [Planctomycetota bacterium]
MKRRQGRIAIALCAVLGAAGWGPAPPPETASLRREIYASFEQQDPARALELLERYLRRFPDDAVMLYNAACAHSRLGEVEESVAYLRRAVRAGFHDFSHMRRDPDLRVIRDQPVFQAILDARDVADPILAARRIERWKGLYGAKRYRYEADEQRRIHYVTSLDETSHARMRRMLERLGGQAGSTLFGPPAEPRHYLLVAVLDAGDAEGVFEDPHARGVYRHGTRELIAADAGRALRHEFIHALHHDHMDRLGQEHALWVQEGLAALYESYEIDAGGSIVFRPNERHNITRSLAREGRLLGWARLFNLPEAQWVDQPGELYAQVRSVFEFIAETGKLEPWYRAYVERFDEDGLGARAMELVFESALPEIEQRWRRWLEREENGEED